MSNKDAKAVGKALEGIGKRTQQAQELFYDPNSGVLEVTHKGELVQDKDRVPATEMIREGFFR